MHGWWWPGRQVVVIAPLLVIVIAWWLGQVRPPRIAALLLGLGAVLGIGSWAWTLIEAADRSPTLIVDFMTTANPWYRLWRHALPMGRTPSAGDDWLTALWVVLLAGAAVVGWRSARADQRPPVTSTIAPVV
jgi:hypothetical protein